ncbi:MAG: uL15 family ribosomal protein [archaeon]
MKTHKRTKNSRIRGARTCGWGFRQKHKGHGNKGGFGMAGTGKKGDHKKQSAEQSVKGKYFGKQGATSRGTAVAKYEKINLSDIKNNFFVKEGCKINFSKHKILGMGEGFKAEITALAATASAMSKMEKAGGKIILPEVKKTVKQWVKKEKVEEVEKKKE